MRKVSTYKMAFTLLAATSLLAACSDDIDNGTSNGNGNNNEITFTTNVNSVLTGKAATFDNNEALKTEGNFTCTAYNATTTTPYIDATTVVWNDTENDGANKWQFAQDQYWPGASGLDFFAYMPATKPGYITSISYSTARQPQFVCTDLPTTAEGQKTLKEFICALATDKTQANSPSGVSMTFQHVFAKLLFELTNEESDGITVNSITIEPKTPANVFKTGGTCTYNNTNGKWEWSSLTGSEGSIVASLNTPFLVIPNNYQSTEFEITVNVTRSSISTTPMNMSATIKYDKDLMNWKAGYVYKFSLTFTPEILIVDTDKWAEQW